jgi:hypothetical protein
MRSLVKILGLFLLPLSALAAPFTPVLGQPNLLDPRTPAGIEALVIKVGQQLLGRPYVGGNLGEGPAGIYDQDPLYRIDVFDCTTFIETVVTNAYCNNERERMESCLEDYMQKIRYFGNEATFETRNHIAETDWIRSNVRRGFLRDLTQEFGGSHTKYSTVITDKKSWFENRSLEDIQTHDSAAEKNRKLTALRSLGSGIAPEAVTVPYLGFDLLFLPGYSASSFEPNTDLLKRLPNGAVFNVVRENWDPPGSGTALAISHQGFIVQKADGTYLRHASTDKSVLEVKLVDYMIQYINSPTIRGLNILQVLPKP